VLTATTPGGRPGLGDALRFLAPQAEMGCSCAANMGWAGLIPLFPGFLLAAVESEGGKRDGNGRAGLMPP